MTTTRLSVAIPAAAALWAAVAHADGTPDHVTAQCMNWRVSAGSVHDRKPSAEVCREVAAHGKRLRETCHEVGEKLAGEPIETVSCSTWRRSGEHGRVAVPDLPDDVWNAHANRDRMRALLERRLGKDWEQPQVQKDLEAVGFACGMTKRILSHEIIGELDTARFVCAANVGTTYSAGPIVAYGFDIWVEVQFAERGELRPWQKIEVTSEAAGAF